MPFLVVHAYWRGNSHLLGGCSLSNLNPISTTSPPCPWHEKLLHIKRNGLRSKHKHVIFATFSHLCHRPLSSNSALLVLWNARHFQFSVVTLKYINLQNENGLIFRIMCNEKQWSTWIHHILGLFVDKWEAARGNKKTKCLCALYGSSLRYIPGHVNQFGLFSLSYPVTAVVLKFPVPVPILNAPNKQTQQLKAIITVRAYPCISWLKTLKVGNFMWFLIRFLNALIVTIQEI